MALIHLPILLGIAIQVALAIPYSEYILTPKSRTITPVSVYNVNGTINNAEALTSTGLATFQGHSAVTYDFGKNVGGIVSFEVGSVQGANQYIGISFTESSLWINSEGCDATADAGIDEALWFQVSSGGSYRAEKKHQRGGFRYLNVYHNSTGSVEVGDLSIHFTAIPQVAESDLGAYTGYFHCDDDQLNRVWYAGAYTNELCTIDPTAGNALLYFGTINSTSSVSEPLAWYYNYTIANGTSVLVDGAKRDRLVWPGDMAIAVPSIAVSTYELTTIRDSLTSLLIHQNKSTGALPYAGVPLAYETAGISYTYHLYSLIGIYDYYLYSGDSDYVKQNWDTYNLALGWSLSYIDATGLANVTQSADWLRFGMGGHNIEANAILYYVLNQGVALAKVVNDTTVAAWSGQAATIKQAAYQDLWDASANLYRDNDTLPLTQLHPQDGNSWAVISGLTTSDEQNANISAALAARWGPYGAPAPEAGATVSPFISGFELQAHYAAGHPERAVKLMKFMWADFMLDDPRMTNSTFIEGYSTNGELHYAPYSNDPRISHAHGWATGPTSALTYYAAGLQIDSASGQTWKIAPSLGGLKSAEAGYETNLGTFASNVKTNAKGMVIQFSTPRGTSGSISIEYPGKAATLSIYGGAGKPMKVHVPASGQGRFEVQGLKGGSYKAVLVVQ